MRFPMLFSCVLVLSGAAAAQAPVVIYRCTDASGALTVQNDVPCPKGSRQDRRVIEDAVPSTPTSPVYERTPIPPSAPATVSAEARDAAPLPRTEAAAASAEERLPPPRLFECRTYDNDRYLNDTGAPPERCVPLSTNGLDGRPTSAAACEMVSDQCHVVADGALCEGWRQRLREVQSALRFGQAGNRDAAQAEVERIERIVGETTCGADGSM